MGKKSTKDKKENYISIPYTISSRSDLTQTQKMIYGMVLGYKNSGKIFYASNKFIADTLSLKEQAVSRAISCLVSKDMIKAFNPNGHSRSIVAEDYPLVVEDNNLVVEDYEPSRGRLGTWSSKTNNNLVDNIVNNLDNNLVNKTEISNEKKSKDFGLLKDNLIYDITYIDNNDILKKERVIKGIGKDVFNERFPDAEILKVSNGIETAF